MNAPEYFPGKQLAQERPFPLVNQVPKCVNVNGAQSGGQCVKITSGDVMAPCQINDEQQSENADDSKNICKIHRLTILSNFWSQNSISDFCRPLPANAGTDSGRKT